MKKLYILLLLCLSISCKKQAQTPEKFLKTINSSINIINETFEESDLFSTSKTIDSLEVKLSIKAINKKIRKAIGKIENLEEINDSLALKKEILIYLNNVDQLFNIDFKQFMLASIPATSSNNSLSEVTKLLPTITDSSSKILNKSIAIMSEGEKINEKVKEYHTMYKIPLPDYLKEKEE